MTELILEEIHGFASLSEYRKFVHFVEDLVANGDLSEVPSDPDYGFGQIYGGRWFATRYGAVKWRLVAPDVPFKGLWERIHVAARDT